MTTSTRAVAAFDLIFAGWGGQGRSLVLVRAEHRRAGESELGKKGGMENSATIVTLSDEYEADL